VAPSSRWVAFRQLDLYYEGTPTTTVAYVKTGSPAQAGTSATLKGSVGMYLGNVSETTCGFDYKLKSASAWTTVTCDAPAASFSKELSLPIGDYVYKAWVSVGGVKKYGVETSVSFYTGLSIDIILGTVTDATGLPAHKDAYYFPSNGQASTNATYRNDNRIIEYDLMSGYDFRFWATYGISRATGSGNLYGMRVNPQGTSSGNPYGGKDGRAWMQLPAIPSMTLKSVRWVLYSANTAFKWALVSNVTTNTEATPPTCSIAEGATNFGSMDFSSTTDQTINVTGAAPGVGYYMVTTANAYNGTISEIHLVYTSD
jgi:hypothetical protein